MCTTLVLFVCLTIVLVCIVFYSYTQMVMTLCWVTERGHIQTFFWLLSYTSCANRAQLATVWSTGDTCTVCGHPTMSNYFTMYSYKIVGVAVLAFTYRSGYHCYSYYLRDYNTCTVCGHSHIYFSAIRVYFFSTICLYCISTICVCYFSTIHVYYFSTIHVYYFSTIRVYYFSTIYVYYW